MASKPRSAAITLNRFRSPPSRSLASRTNAPVFVSSENCHSPSVNDREVAPQTNKYCETDGTASTSSDRSDASAFAGIENSMRLVLGQLDADPAKATSGEIRRGRGNRRVRRWKGGKRGEAIHAYAPEPTRETTRLRSHGKSSANPTRSMEMTRAEKSTRFDTARRRRKKRRKRSRIRLQRFAVLQHRHLGAVQEADQGFGAVRLLQLANRLAFDLTHAFAGDLKDLADFFQGVRVAVGQTVSQPQDFAFAIVQRFHRQVDLNFQGFAVRFHQRIFVAVVFQEFAESAFFVITDRLVQ